MTRRYKAFISYSWADKEWGEWVHRALETYRTPHELAGSEGAFGAIPERLHPIFKDREEEAAGHGITAAIEAALADSEFLIVVCSPNSAKSNWVNREIAWFKTHRDRTRILALVVAGEPLASFKGDEANECFPKALLYEVDGDLQPTEKAEDPPLAADARKEGDGKRGAKLKLAAALLGAGLDALVRRDERRRAIRRRAVMGGMAASMAVLSGLTVFAFTQRNAAVVARNDAEFQRDEAEGLVEFMLTDLRKRLDAVGRLDVLDSVGERALKYYANQDVKRLDPDALGRRSRAQLLVGEVDNTRGDLDAALKAYKEAASTTEELLRRDPNNAQRIFDHAQSVFWVGYIAWQRGNAETARKFLTQYKDYADQLVAIDPDKEEWQTELMYAHSNLGTLAMDEGDAEAAEAHFRPSLDIALKLLAKSPDDVDRMLEAGQSYAWLADALYRQTKIADARSDREAELNIYDRILTADPHQAEALKAASSTLHALGLIATASNNLKSAVEYSTRAAKISQEIAAKEPDNVDLAATAANSYALLGEARYFSNQLSESRNALETALDYADKLKNSDKSVALWRGRITAQPRLMLARVDASEDDFPNALSHFTEAKSDLQNLIEQGAANSIMVRRYCEVLAGRARISSDFSGAWRQIIALLEPDRRQQGPEALALLAEAYVEVGRTDDAKAITKRLYSAGFRHPDFLALLKAHPDLLTERRAASAPR